MRAHKLLRIVAAAMLLCGNVTVAVAETLQRPKLVVGIVVDQMRWDYIYRFYDEYGDSGFKRMLSEGYACQNTMINYLPSATAVGHTAVFTGSVPSITGICNNAFYVNGKYMNCCTDNDYKTVGAVGRSGERSPRNLNTTTIGDELKIATEFKSKVIGVAVKDRAAIFPSGHSADGAFWFDSKTSKAITSTYYMDELPKWVKDYNKSHKEMAVDTLALTPEANVRTIELAEAAIRGENLGGRGVTDLLTVSFSATDYLGHKIGGHNERIKTMYLELDKSLGDFFGFLDKTIGKGEYVAFLTADHGASNNINFMRNHKIPSEPFVEKDVVKALDEALKSELHVSENLVENIFAYQIRLKRQLIDSLGLDIETVKKTATKALRKMNGITYAVDMENVESAAIPSVIKTKIINAYYPERGGDIMVITKPQVVASNPDPGTRATHGQWNPYDAHIPFIIMGWHVNHGATYKTTSITDIAPTVCALLNIQVPSGCIGSAVDEAIDKD